MSNWQKGTAGRKQGLLVSLFPDSGGHAISCVGLVQDSGERTNEMHTGVRNCCAVVAIGRQPGTVYVNVAATELHRSPRRQRSLNRISMGAVAQSRDPSDDNSPNPRILPQLCVRESTVSCPYLGRLSRRRWGRCRWRRRRWRSW